MTLWCRWLGVAGIELNVEGRGIIIDPYFTRFPLWKMWIGPIYPDRDLIIKNIPRCDTILVTHAHFDHVMDVPIAALHTGATVMGSRNTCLIAGASGVPAKQIRRIEAGDRLELGDFRVDVLPARHGKTAIDRIINGPMPADLKIPLRALDYRMDQCLAFLVEVDGLRILIGSGEIVEENTPADILFVGAIALENETDRYYSTAMERTRPSIVIPYHWDDMFRPLSKPVRPTYRPPSWTIPPLRRVDLSSFSRMIDTIAPGTTVIIPEIFRLYNINELL
ncbi:MAG: MBL fold metallo-hydrolase [Anaerolineae bacterium]|nr:MBL fold metallo-hydrolase [Anaerolineae bacterium]